MESATKGVHAVFLPYPAQGHLGAMLKLAKLFHQKGFYITFVLTEHIHKRLQISRGSHALEGIPRFRFETIPDGLEENTEDDKQDLVELFNSLFQNGFTPFRDLILKLNNSTSTHSADFPLASFVVYDAFLGFAVDAAEEVGIPAIAFWPFSATAVMCFYHFPDFSEGGIAAPKDENYLKNGYLEKTIDWIPGIDGMQFKYFNSIELLMCPDNPSYKQLSWIIQRTYHASAVLVNTFDALEFKVLEPISSMIENLHTIGPINFLLNQLPKGEDSLSLDTNLWKHDDSYLEWLNSKETGSVIYVNFGSIATLTQDQLVEFAWGLAQSMQNFLWIIRPNLTFNGSNDLPPEFLAEIKGRGMLSTWCNQEQVLEHPSVGGFLTHCGWNSIVESLTAGIQMLCWPYFGDQRTNCFCCTKLWNVAMEIDGDVKREQVEKLVREIIQEEKGKTMREKVVEWKNKAQISAKPGGSSYLHLDKLIEQIVKSSGKEI